MLLLAGLGNPGPKYELNRHNIGFMVADAIVRRHGFAPYRARFQSLVSDGRLAGRKVLVIKPMTFMNDSGRAVGAALRYYKLSPGDLMVIHDEIDLRAGKVRVKLGGGNAGHNGLRSIDAHIGPDYHRLRIGVGHPGDKLLVHGHVLNDFRKEEMPGVEKLVEAIAETVPFIAEGKTNLFMSRLALLTEPEAPQPEANGAPSG